MKINHENQKLIIKYTEDGVALVGFNEDQKVAKNDFKDINFNDIFDVNLEDRPQSGGMKGRAH